MFLFKKFKKLSQMQKALVGFVLAVLSILSMAVIVYIFPLLGAWMNMNAIYHLDLFFLAFLFVLFVSVQGLILFGFPLFYAKDKKCHMTGFQILLYALGWMVLIVVGLVVVTVLLKGAAAVDPYGLDSFDYDAFQDMDGAAVEVIE